MNHYLNIITAIKAMQYTWAEVYDDRYDTTESIIQKYNAPILSVVISVQANMLDPVYGCFADNIRVMLKAFAPKDYCKNFCDSNTSLAQAEYELHRQWRSFFLSLYQYLTEGIRDTDTNIEQDTILKGYHVNNENPDIRYGDLQNGLLGDTAMQQVSLSAEFYILGSIDCCKMPIDVSKLEVAYCN